MSENDILLCHVLHCRPIDLLINKPVLTDTQQQQLNHLKQRRANGEPLQYIIGEWDFMGLTFKVDPSVLVPRPETEVMVEEAIVRLKSFTAPNVLDLGTGSGCIAVSLAKFLPTARLTAVDISLQALEVAGANACTHGVADRIRFIHADMQQPVVPAMKGSYDMIISNPPYIPTGAMKHLPVHGAHPPANALDGGADGLMFYRQIIKLTGGLLTPQGCLMMEFGDGQSNDIRRMCEAHFNHIHIHQDLTGRDRFISARS